MNPHLHLRRQIEEHLGTTPLLAPELARLLDSIDATYRQLMPENPPIGSRDGTPSFAAVFESVSDGVVVRSADGRFVAHNAAAERLLGLDSAQLRGETARPARWRLVDERGADLPLDLIPSARTFLDGKPHHRVLLGVLPTGDSVRWLSVSSTPVHDRTGSLIAVVATLVDVTDLAGRIPSTSLGVAPESPPGAKRPTMRQIATALGVSAATVSMALRENPRISTAMQERVRTAADQLGYHPDPQLRRAMSTLRSGGRASFRSTLCAMTDLASLGLPYVEAMIAAVRSRADRLGYGFALEHLNRERTDGAKLGRRLFHCGIEGVLILPIAAPWYAAEFLEWDRFSVVAAGYAVRTPDFDRVASHWFGSARGVYAQLSALGYRRIGAVISRPFDRVVDHRVTGAISSAPLHLPVAEIEPFYHCAMGTVVPRRQGGSEAPLKWPHVESFTQWFVREQPDALVFDCEPVATAVLKAMGWCPPDPVGIAVLAREPGSRFAGWEERPAEIGAMAVEWLDQKIRARDRGAAAVPSKRLVLGAWRDGTTVRRQIAAAPAVLNTCSLAASCSGCAPSCGVPFASCGDVGSRPV